MTKSVLYGLPFILCLLGLEIFYMSSSMRIPEATGTAFDSLLKVVRREGDKKMPMNTLEATVSTFDGVFEKFTSESPKHKANFIVFLADKDPSTNLSWCPGKIQPIYVYSFVTVYLTLTKIIIL